MAKTNIGLVEYVKAKKGKPYWYGTFGQIATEILYKAKKQQYPKYYTADNFRSQFGQQVFDCIGLIKAYLWTTSINDTKPIYKASEDWSADATYSHCKEKGSISTMPEIPGLLVFKTGHVGVYIGNGSVIEAKGHAYGVVETPLKNRQWQTWGKHPLIEYVGDDGKKGESVNKTGYTIKELTGLAGIRKGYKGCGVQIIQANLAKLGYYKKEIDGSYGEGTEKAVRDFQGNNGLNTDGVFGPRTSAKLSKVIVG